MKILKQAALALPLVAVPLAAQAGVVLEMEYRDLADKTSTTSQTFVEGKYIKMKTVKASGAADADMIYRPGGGGRTAEMLMIDHGEKSYAVMDEASMKRMGSMMDEALKSVPPEQRAMVMEMMKQQGQVPGAPQEPKRELRATGRSDTVAGIGCKVWEALENGVKTQEICAAGSSAFPGGVEAMPAFIDLSRFMQKMLASMPSIGAAMDQSLADYEKLNGFPLRVRDYEGGKVTSEVLFKSSKTQTLAPSFFQAPAGYKKQDMFGGN